jgi:hypothetical protein
MKINKMGISFWGDVCYCRQLVYNILLNFILAIMYLDILDIDVIRRTLSWLKSTN